MPIMLIVCCVCKCSLGYKHCSAEQDGQITHSLCPACEKIEHAKIDKIIKDKKI